MIRRCFKCTALALLVPAILCALLISACSRQADSEQEEIVARVGDRVITRAQFEAEMQRRGRVRPGYFNEERNRRDLLDELIRHQRLINEAEDAGIPQQPEFRALVERMMIQRLREDRLGEALEAAAVTDQEVRRFYEENQAEFARPDRRRIAMIQIALPPGFDEERLEQARAQAESARAAALAIAEQTDHFGAVAVEFSSDRGSRYQGGVVGWLVDHAGRRYQWPERVLQAAFEMQDPGVISEPIEAEDGIYLLRLVELEPGRDQPLNQVADGIRHRLTRERARDLEGALFDDIVERHPASINQSVFDAVEPPDPSDLIPPPREPVQPPALPGGGAVLHDPEPSRYST